MVKKIAFTMIFGLILSFCVSADNSEQNWAADFYNLLNSRTDDNIYLDEAIKNRPQNLEYQNWFNDLFIKVFQDSEPSFMSSELEKIEYALKAKPDYKGTGESYDVFLKAFTKYLFDYGYSLTSSEKTSLNILLKARPDLIKSEKHFALFAADFDTMLSECEPTLTSSEKEVIHLLISVKPLSDSNGYKRWNEMYQKFYNSYSPNFTGSEQEILNLILTIKPEITQQDQNPEYLKIRVNDLRRLRIHIRNQENLDALKLLDYLLSSGLEY